MQKVIGLITCNYSAKATSPLTEYRPISSLPFLGRYRLVDFALSNLVNCRHPHRRHGHALQLPLDHRPRRVRQGLGS